MKERTLRWLGSTESPRKLWLRAGRCRVEVVGTVQIISRGTVNKYSWCTYNRDDNPGSMDQARSLAVAKRAALAALIQQAELGWSGFHIGQRTLEKLKRFAALEALGADG